MEVQAEAANVRMDAKDKVEVVQRAIQQLMEEKFNDEDGRVVLSRMLLQLESLKVDATKLPKPSSETKEELMSSSEGSEVETTAHEIPKLGTEDIVRELENVKRQNSMTHWLLSALIVITAVWQLSEVSLIMMVRNKVSHPFSAVRNFITGVIKGGGKDDDSVKIPLPSSKRPQTEPLLSHPLKIPEFEFEFPHVDLPRLNSSED
eukprot:TRINITY_DN2202_c0_g1_i1.p1 TRINITY_DN2202_c0_g1~~TRINITY_DN2202_c0_g1_i1.p1  ORF type:complete len:205 (+),score=29.07 TRINITY_DN2202_c0_g1_i1:56-670(+)